MYPKTIPEQELKNKVAIDFFTEFNHTQILGNIDFCISYSDNTLYEHINFLWAEAKKGNDKDIIESFIQLILAIGKERSFEDILPPLFLGAFDCEKIAFIPYHEIMHIFSQNDFNWNVAPSNHATKEFQELYNLTKNLLESKKMLFYFESDNTQLKEFIKQNFTLINTDLIKTQITKNNFVNIYLKWIKHVKEAIMIDWDKAKLHGILDADFYLADLLSAENHTITDKLQIILQKDHYELNRKINEMGLFSSDKAEFKRDKAHLHQSFWNLYERPPKEEFWDYIIQRRDLLVPQDIREYKGAFFTPPIWVEKSQSYLVKALGENYQDEYYIWDCAAGTGNLLAGLNDKYKIFASTLDDKDVGIMRERIKNGANLLESHVFQFDFLNDSFFDRLDSKGNIIEKSKLPKNLQEILKDENKRKKLIIYINPPYAEATSAKTPIGTGKNKTGVAIENRIYETYKETISKASNELFAQFFIRIYKEIDGCILASFSTLKYINSTNFQKFRETFKAKFLKGFICPAYSFDNVQGKFPIGFLIWNLDSKVDFKRVRLDVFDIGGKKIGRKSFYTNIDKTSINKWLNTIENKKSGREKVGLLDTRGNDFQNQQYIRIESQNVVITVHSKGSYINVSNLIPISIYFAVRQCIKATWINNNDQFLTPKKAWKKDRELHNDCLAFMLFHSKNRITSKEGINHFIPFSEKEVDSKATFDSHFLSDFIKGKLSNSYDSSTPCHFERNEESPSASLRSVTQAIQNNKTNHITNNSLFQDEFITTEPIIFSDEAQVVFNEGKKLWAYYHAQSFNHKDNAIWHSGDFYYLNEYNPNASLYDIRAYFQGFNEKGRMNARSKDSHYNDLLANLKYALESLASKIAKKVYEYEFLLC